MRVSFSQNYKCKFRVIVYIEKIRNLSFGWVTDLFYNISCCFNLIKRSEKINNGNLLTNINLIVMIYKWSSETSKLLKTDLKNDLN